jgi:23S rRNA pseudouridine955/2504/2580 synthase
VHRLDRDTSGVLLIAKKRSALTSLHDQMREGTTDKRYLTLVQGDWKNARQHVKLPLFKYSTPDGERRVGAGRRPAFDTMFSLLRRFGEFALLEAELKTGRTHQIRVHLSSSGFPIVGDDKYGDFTLNKALQKADGKRVAFKRMFLHAWRISQPSGKRRDRHPQGRPARGMRDSCAAWSGAEGDLLPYNMLAGTEE